MSRMLNLMMRRAVPAPFTRATRILKTEMFERPLWYDVVKYAPPITYQAPTFKKPRVGLEERLYQRLLRARPMLRLEPMNSLSNTPSLGYRFVTTQLMLMRNDRLPERVAFATTLKALTPELEKFEESLQFTGLSKFKVSKEKVLHNLGTLMAAAAPGSSTAAAAAELAAKRAAAAATASATAAATANAEASKTDFANVLKSASGGSIMDPVAVSTSVSGGAKRKSAPLQSEPIEQAPARAVARPVYYDLKGRVVKGPSAVVEAKWAWDTEIEPVIDPTGSERLLAEHKAGVKRDFKAESLPYDNDDTSAYTEYQGLTAEQLQQMLSQKSIKPGGVSGPGTAEGGAAAEAEADADLSDATDAKAKANADAEDESDLDLDLYPVDLPVRAHEMEYSAEEIKQIDAGKPVKREWYERALAKERAREELHKKELSEWENSVDAAVEAEYDVAVQKALAAAEEIKASGVTAVPSAAERIVEDFDYSQDTTRAELEEYLEAKVELCLPDAPESDKDVLRRELVFNLKLKRAYQSFEILRQAVLSNSDRKLDLALRATYDDIFGFAKPFEDRDVLRSVVYEVTQATDMGGREFVDPALTKKRVDLRSLLRQARDVRVAQEQLAASQADADGGGAGASDVSSAASTFGSAGGKVSLTSLLDSLSAAASAPKVVDSAATATRNAKIAEIKAELASLRKFSDQRWELAAYLSDQLQKKRDDAMGKKPRGAYAKQPKMIFRPVHWRNMLVTESDVMQRLIGIDALPSYGTAEAQRLVAIGQNPAAAFARESRASSQFAPIGSDASAPAGSKLHIANAYPMQSGSASTKRRGGAGDSEKKALLPTVITTNRYGKFGHFRAGQFQRLANTALVAADPEKYGAKHKHANSASAALDAALGL